MKPRSRSNGKLVRHSGSVHPSFEFAENDSTEMAERSRGSYTDPESECVAIGIYISPQHGKGIPNLNVVVQYDYSAILIDGQVVKEGISAYGQGLI